MQACQSMKIKPPADAAAGDAVQAVCADFVVNRRNQAVNLVTICIWASARVPRHLVRALVVTHARKPTAKEAASQALGTPAAAARIPTLGWIGTPNPSVPSARV